jgi:WD40 repeat protein
MKRTVAASNHVSLINNLPSELFGPLFSYMGCRDIMRCKRVCQVFREILNTEGVWVEVFNRQMSWIKIRDGLTYKRAFLIYVQLWTGLCLSRSWLIYDPGAITAMIMDNNRVIVAGRPSVGSICVWDLDKNSITNCLDIDERITEMAICQRYLVASANKSIYVWNKETGDWIKKIERNFCVTCLDSDGHRLVIGGEQDNTAGIVELWDLEENRVETVLTCKGFPVKLKLDGESVVVGDVYGTLSLVGLTPTTKKDPIKSETNSCYLIHSFVVYEEFLISCASYGIKVWDRKTLAPKKDHALERAFPVEESTVCSLTLWDKMLISTSWRNFEVVAGLWNMAGEHIRILQLSPDQFKPVMVYQDKLICASAKEAGKIQILNYHCDETV